MTIRFKAKLCKIKSWAIIRLPQSASAGLPSRGMTMVAGIINGLNFQAPLEPDGKGSHWFRVNKTMCQGAKATIGDTVTLSIEPLQEWPEPGIPTDLKQAFEADPQALERWLDVTTKAHWDWIRWIRSTKNPETRKIRIEKTFSKLKSGKRNPCCFNRSLCTETEVSKSGILLEPTE